MIKIVDSHCHLNCLDLTAYAGDLHAAIAAAKHNDVAYMLCVCIDLEHFHEVLSIANQYPQIFASVGLHPNERVAKEPTTEKLVKLGNHEKIIAVGETGLDYYRSQDTDMSWQHLRFRYHITAAKQLNKPIIVHMRDAAEDTIAIMQQEKAQNVGGVMHCFTSTWEVAKQAMDLGFYISFSGIVTFKNANSLQEVAKRMPSDRILIETDCPYLAPMPYRGRSNEPAYLQHTAKYIAQLRHISYQDIAQQTTENFFKCFRIVQDE